MATMTVEDALEFADEAKQPEVSFNCYEYEALRRLAAEVRALQKQVKAFQDETYELRTNLEEIQWMYDSLCK